MGEDNKRVYVDAIIGSGFKGIDECVRMEKLGLARFSGNQWNENWEWVRSALEQKSAEHLARFYRSRIW